jgi:CBS domain-containing protein
MRLGTLFTNKVITAGPRHSIGWVIGLMQQENVGTVVIVEDQRPVGIVTDRDLVIALGMRAKGAHDVVGEVMRSPVATIGQHEGVFRATRYMKEQTVRRLVVVDDIGRVIGIVSLDDLLHLLARELQNLADCVDTEVTAPAGVRS